MDTLNKDNATSKAIEWTLDPSDVQVLIDHYQKQYDHIVDQIGSLNGQREELATKIATLRSQANYSLEISDDNVATKFSWYDQKTTRFLRTKAALVHLNKLATTRQIIELWLQENPSLYKDEETDFVGLQGALSATLKPKVVNGDLSRIKVKTGEFYYGMPYWFDTKGNPYETHLPIEQVEFVK